jgi:hypothetical protein
LIVVVVPAMGATFIAGLEGMAGDHSLVAFAVAWKSWWIKDAAGLLLLAPLWTLHSRKAIIENPVRTSVAANLVHTGAPKTFLTSLMRFRRLRLLRPRPCPRSRKHPCIEPTRVAASKLCHTVGRCRSQAEHLWPELFWRWR